MKSWGIAEAKASFSELVAATERAPQAIVRRGVQVAVVLSNDEYAEMLKHIPKLSGVEKFINKTRVLREEMDLTFEPLRDNTQPHSPFEVDDDTNSKLSRRHKRDLGTRKAKSKSTRRKVDKKTA